MSDEMTVDSDNSVDPLDIAPNKGLLTTKRDNAAQPKELEFDGTTVLCRVCGDKASGFHYGVHSCEGCKGFFRRSIQQKIQYRPCTKNQQCSILRINRNRCQYCRLKKCIAVGMSRDAVRFGRVPKREKAKILAAMQKVNQNSQEKQLSEQLEDENRLLATILQAHEETCDYTKEKVAPLVARARTQPVFANCPPQMACPLNPMPQHVENGGANRILEDFSERFSPAIRGVVEYAKRIPGFAMLSQDDQVTLLKAGVFEVLLVRLACMFDSQSNSMICLNGLVLRRESLHSASNARFLLDSMFDFAERMNSLGLSDKEIGLFCAVVVIAPDRPGLRNTDLVQKIHRKLDDLLQKAVCANHQDNPGLFAELKKKIPDLRTLNTLHSEKLLAFKMEPRNNGGMSAVTSSTNGDHVVPTANGNVAACNYASLLPERWQQFGLLNGSNGQGSPHGSDWSDSKDVDTNYGSPRSVSSSVVSTDESASVKSPPRSSSVSSAKSSNGGYLSYSPEMVRCPKRAHTGHHRDGNSSSDESCYYGSESAAKSGSAGGANFAKIRCVDSPTDSGIESGKEHCSGSTPATSVCSSPRSALDEKVKDVSDSEEKQESIDDMPMLKRALQAPPLINTNMLMDEAYRHHKKFRASKREGEPHSPSTTMAASPASSCGDSLASSHSTLVKTLEQAPRYLNEQQLKRTDLIHNIIMRTEQQSASHLPAYHHHSQQQHQMSHAHHHNAVSAPKSGVLVCPPGYYIPQNMPTPGAGCPYSNGRVSSGAPSRIMYNGPPNGMLEAHRRSPLSPAALVIGSTPPPKAATPSSTCARSRTSSPAAAIMMLSQHSDIGSLASDSQPLNLSKKASPPNSPTGLVLKMES